MSIHLKIPEYECKNCKTPFMAYWKDLECPKCNVIEDSDGQGYDFIDAQTGVLVGHNHLYKQFTPYGWYQGSYCDNLQWTIFRIFDYKYKNPELDWEEKIKEIDLIDGDGNNFKNESHLINLFKEIEKKLVIRLEEFKAEREKELAEKEHKRLINRVMRFLKLN